VIFLAAQRYVVQGVTTSGIKGQSEPAGAHWRCCFFFTPADISR
jgi:hypothetical protein